VRRRGQVDGGRLVEVDGAGRWRGFLAGSAFWHDLLVGTVLAVLGVVAVLFVAALVATRDGELLVDAPRDHADLDVPADAAVAADDLDRVRFGMALRGYRMAEVDLLLDRLAAELRDRDARLAELESRGDAARGVDPREPDAPSH